MIIGVRSRGRAAALDRVRLREPGAVRRSSRCFPFYFMLITSFKSNAELYNLKSVPVLDPDRRHHRPLPLPVLRTEFLDLDQEQPDHQRGGDRRSRS